MTCRSTNYQDCDLQTLPLDDLLSALFVVDENGCTYINTVITTADCSGMSLASSCGTNENWEVFLRKSVVLDDCGRPALHIFYHTADTPEEQ